MDVLDITTLCFWLLSVSPASTDFNCPPELNAGYNEDAVISCNSSANIIQVTVKLCKECENECSDNKSNETIINTKEIIFYYDKGMRMQLSLDKHTAKLNIANAKKWTPNKFLLWMLWGTEDFDCRCTKLNVSDPPDNELHVIQKNETEFVCFSSGVSAEGSIHWFHKSDPQMPNRTKTFMEKMNNNNFIHTSVLSLPSPLDANDEYCCTVQYDGTGIRKQTKCVRNQTEIYVRNQTHEASRETDTFSKNTHSGVIIIVVSLLIICVFAIAAFRYRRHKRMHGRYWEFPSNTIRNLPFLNTISALKSPSFSPEELA